MRNDNKTCILCGKQYKYCEGCPDKYNVTETWRNIFCSEECRGLYHIYDLIKAGRMTEKNANKEIKKYDIAVISRLKEPMKSTLAVALNYNNVSNNASDVPLKKTQTAIGEKKEIKETKKDPPVKRTGKKNKDIEVN